MIRRIGETIRRRTQGEDGIALLLVMGMMFALSLVAVAGLAYATNGIKTSRHEQDFDTDSATTQAAAQDFLHHLNICDDYWAGAAYGSTASTCFSAANNNVTNPALTTGAPTNWAAMPYVPGTNSQSNGQYAYQVIGVPFATGNVGTAAVVAGTIRLQVWGHSGNVTRSQVVDFKRESLLNFIYYTDIEGLDPSVLQMDYPAYTATTCPRFNVINSNGSTSQVTAGLNCSFSGISSASAVGACDQHYYAGPSAPGTTNPKGATAPGRYTNSANDYYGTVTYTITTGSGRSATSVTNTATYQVKQGASTSTVGSTPSCQIVFGGGDSINGPLHTNDAIDLGGAVTFTSAQTESSWGFTSSQNSPAPGTNEWIDDCSGCTPSGNNPVKAALITLPPTNSALQSEAESPNTGCEYTGPTQITLNSDGTMNVLSPDTTSATAPNTSTCYTSLPMTSSQKVPLPKNGVVYVVNAASTSACSTTSRPYVGTYPAANDFGTAGVSCTQGDAYLSGTLKGQLTIGSAGNINVVGDTKYNSGLTGTDILGLIANGFVQVYHPVSCPSSYNDPSDGTSCSEINAVPANGITIQAAILSVQHSFTVENFNMGKALSDGSAAKKLHINGVIAQEFRGAVGTGSSSSGTTTGYLKDYNFDSRLQNDPPPYFLDPTSSPWQVFDTSEQ